MWGQDGDQRSNQEWLNNEKRVEGQIIASKDLIQDAMVNIEGLSRHFYV